MSIQLSLNKQGVFLQAEWSSDANSWCYLLHKTKQPTRKPSNQPEPFQHLNATSPLAPQTIGVKSLGNLLTYYFTLYADDDPTVNFKYPPYGYHVNVRLYDYLRNDTDDMNSDDEDERDQEDFDSALDDVETGYDMVCDFVMNKWAVTLSPRTNWG